MKDGIRYRSILSQTQLRLVGDALAPHEEGPQAPLWVHDAQLSASLAVLLVDPTLDPVCRQAQAVQGLPRLAVAQAGLPAKAGGLSLLPASSLWAVARLAGAMAVRPYLIEHADAFCLPASALSTVSTLTYYSGLRAAFRRNSGLLAASRLPRAPKTTVPIDPFSFPSVRSISNPKLETVSSRYR